MSRRNKVRYQAQSMAEINMTNLIDVTMVLLIIFILVSNFVTSGLNINVPKVTYSQVSGKERIIVHVDDKGGYALNRNAMPKENLESQLSEIHRQYPEDDVYVQSHPNAVYGDIALIISVAQKVGFAKVNLPLQDQK